MHHCLGAPLARMEMRLAFPRSAPALPRPRPGRPGRASRLPVLQPRARPELTAGDLVNGRPMRAHVL
ncbi:hypothetical protein [Nonomuraea glycinis]|uniref:hypothetical protein n=1 Tax=Nonomuraea glycinis TaxID=2047744 RepID=UPI0035590908